MQRHASRLGRKVRAHHANDAICYIFRPEFRRYVDLFQPRYLVYHAYDAYSQLPGWTPLLQRYEAEIVERADLIIATTDGVMERIPKGGSAPRRILLNAADYKTFTAATGSPCPPDLANIPQPRIGYSGSINQKVDFPLVRAIARARPHWQWVFIGHTVLGSGSPDADPEISAAYNDCVSLPNVHFLGPRPRAEIPSYLVHMDVNTMCYRPTRGWWEHAYPLKLHESLASGKPVVAPPLKNLVQFRDIIELASGADEWIAALERALNDKRAERAKRRIAVAFENTWDLRADQLETWLREMIDRRSRSETDED
jgi:glycosyltransferase involved in cell wall biosynthesis